MESIIKVDHLSHRYSVQWAIKDICFEISRQGIYGLLGSNGAGKSTLMNIICGIIKQSSGKVYINSIEMGGDSIAAKSHIGFLPQSAPVYTDLNVTEYLRYTAELRGVEDSKIAGAVERVLELCRLTQFRKRLIGSLSGGYQQRVGIAQAIIHEPDIVIFDEPTNGLDPNQVADIRGLLRLIAQERTVIFSSHQLHEVKELCEHVFMVEQGHIVFDGSINEFDNAVVPDSIFVTMRDAPAISSLELLPGIQCVEELNECDYRLRFSNVQEAMDAVVRASAENGWKLTEIRLEKKSLEAIFAELAHKSRDVQ